MTTTEMAQHIEDVTSWNRVRVATGTRGGRAWRRRKEIRIPPVTTARRYALALHELGHVLGPQRGTRLARELQAWVWARWTARAWTPEMDAEMARSLESYNAWAKRRKGVDKSLTWGQE